MQIIRKICTHIAVYVCVLIPLWLMLAVTCTVPNELLVPNMTEDALSYKNSEPFSFTDGQRFNAVADNYANAILLGVSWNMGIGDNPFSSSLNTSYFDGEELGENAAEWNLLPR